jgi:hypothetical protein
MFHNEEGDICTYRKHSLDYFTVDGVTLRTGFSNKHDWYLLCIRELLDNAVDFLSKNYKGSDDTVVDVNIFKDDKVFRLKVRNSNYKNIPVLTNLQAVFDYEMRYGSKQEVHVISRGMLGDALKQIRAFEYVLLHVDYDDTTSFEDKQANHPIVIRHNGKKSKVYLNVDKVRQRALVEVQEEEQGCSKDGTTTDTEIEDILPVIDEVRDSLNRKRIEDFCKKYPLFTTDITFRFHITDNSDYHHHHHNDDPVSNNGGGDDIISSRSSTYKKEEQLAKTLLSTTESPKATLNIEYKALHPISSEAWTEQNSVHSYTPEEFKRPIVNIQSIQAAKTQISVYDLLVRTYREASNLKKTDENKITITELLSQLCYNDKERNKKIERYYKQLRNALPPPSKLTLPYTTNKQQRKAILAKRLVDLYNNNSNNNHEGADKLDTDLSKASYKSIHGYYQDEKRGISYPYFFEILAIPFAYPRYTTKRLDFIGAINYSISPKIYGSLFEGEYDEALLFYEDPDNDPTAYATDILGVLEHYGFHEYQTDYAKIPCVVIANLVTPRRDPHGQDKSRIDTSPFVGTISEGVRRIATEIKTYRGRGIFFDKPKERRNAVQHSSGKVSLKKLLTGYLVKQHGMPALPTDNIDYREQAEEEDEELHEDEEEEDEEYGGIAKEEE